MSYSHSVPSFDLEMGKIFEEKKINVFSLKVLPINIDVELQSTVPIKSKTPDSNTNILSTCSSNVNLNFPCAMRGTTAALTSSLALRGVDIVIYESTDEY
ncbi:unnamed protein product [Rotaria magnacalcarata]|uniref:Uncharacterized protein n=1 Tax=Rotaria magnacalcarata TaxID=392030 RepID=A0A8S3HYF1_9BILA|nr:unnamed protein product [Rotaria magnacalcarata]